MKKILFAALLAAAPLALTSASAQQPNMVGATNADPWAQSGRAFAQAVYMSDKFEILAGKMAQEKGSRAVADYGQNMIAAHTESSEDLKAILGHNVVGSRVTPPPVLDPHYMAMYHELEAAGRRNFDRIYLEQQRAVHEDALATMQGYVDNGRVEDMQNFARHMVPVVRDHIAMLQAVRRDLAYND